MVQFKFSLLTLSASALILLTPIAGHATTMYNSTATPTTAPAPAAAPPPATAAAPAITQAPPSAQAIAFGKQAGAVCPGKWDSAECLSVVSTSNLAMASNFAAALKDKGLEADAEQVKQHCAASTAAQKQAYPGYAMKSAFIECANLIADLAQKTGVQPDLSQYQLMVGATMCLDNDLRCAGIAEQLKALAAK